MEEYLQEELKTEDIIDTKFSFLAFVSLVGFLLSLFLTSGSFRMFIAPQLLSFGFFFVSFGVAVGWKEYIYENGKADAEPVLNSIYSSVFIFILQGTSYIPIISILMGPDFPLIFVIPSAAGISFSFTIIYVNLIKKISGISDDYIQLETDLYKDENDKSIAFTQETYENYLEKVTKDAQESSS